METCFVARDNSGVLTVKLGRETSLFAYSTDKRSTHIIVIDYYSRYPEASQLRDTKSKTVISKLKSILGRHGILEVVPDNGLQYSSCEFQQFAKDYDLRHMTTSPRYPQSGGLHEKQSKTSWTRPRKLTKIFT